MLSQKNVPKHDSSWCEGRPDTNLLSEMRADVLLVLAVSVELQLLLVGMSRLLQSDQGSGQKLFLVPLPLLGHHSQLCLGEVLPVPHTFMLHLEEQHAWRRHCLHTEWGDTKALLNVLIGQVY